MEGILLYNVEQVIVLVERQIGVLIMFKIKIEKAIAIAIAGAAGGSTLRAFSVFVGY